MSWSADCFSDFCRDAGRDAIAREQERRLLHDELHALRALGFGAARIPEKDGGLGWSLTEVLTHQIALARADASLGHVWRGHIAFVERLRLRGDGAERWYPRIRRGDFVGNAQSERHDTARLATELVRHPDGTVTVSGTKFYTTGSIYADWIHLAALDGDDRVAITVTTHQTGVSSIDDWDGFGQQLTGSGTTHFTDARVDVHDIDRDDADAALWPLLGSVYQLSLIATIAGIAERARDDVLDFVRPRKRTFGYAGTSLPREDPLVQLVVGEISGAAAAAKRLVLSVARDLDAAIDEGYDVERLREVQLEVYRLQDIIPSLVLSATTKLFEVGGASAVSRSAGLDRHWRNVRTIATHNPVAQRTAAIGQYELNGTLPEWTAPAR